MRRWLILLAVFTVGIRLANAADDSATPPEQPSVVSEEAEERGIIPTHDDIHVSTQTITPITVFPEKPGYLQALDEFRQAQELWHNGYAEAASDVALVAYDDLINVHIPGMKRSQRHKLIYEAAVVYVQSSIQTIRNYLSSQGHSPEALLEAQGRMDDVRDVARNYQGLNSLLSEAKQSL